MKKKGLQPQGSMKEFHKDVLCDGTLTIPFNMEFKNSIPGGKKRFTLFLPFDGLLQLN